MISFIKLTAVAGCLLYLSGTLVADPLPEQMTFVPWTSGTWKSEWLGVTKRTYFYQWTHDMVTWHYAPYVAFGTGGHENFMASSPSKVFVRLHSVDDTTATTLQQARDADFDNDGIPNSYEVETIFTNPLDKNSAGGDSDSDGLADGWELFYFGGLGIADPNAILKPDGLTNKEKSELGLNPNMDYSAASAAQTAVLTYDLTGRLTGVTAPVGAGTYNPDDEGNLLNAQ